MLGLKGIGRSRQPPAERVPNANDRRDRIALLAAASTICALALVFVAGKGTHFLMPGPLASAHGTIETCGTCHTKSGTGKLSWVHGLVAGDPLADSKACLACHKMPDTAFNPHSAQKDVLRRSTERLIRIAGRIPEPPSARAQSLAFPTRAIEARGLYCATCHQEHQGTAFTLDKISNEQCRSCHVARFESFDSGHPKFESFPFDRRTRIVYDHDSHFGKHYPEVEKKDPAARIPETCSTCHTGKADKRLMGVAAFDKTCASCHLDQITGKARVSGPKGIAFLALPGLDLASLKTKNAAIGEWPEASEAALTPFMKFMISRTERGRDLIKAVEGLNLQDLAEAKSAETKAVTDLAWEIKKLLFALVSEKASDVFGDIGTENGVKLDANAVSALTAGIPRDVLAAAQKQWLPNLAAEIANGPGAVALPPAVGAAAPRDEAVPESAAPGDAVPGESARTEVEEESPEPGQPAEGEEGPKTGKRDPQPCLLRVLGQCLMSKEEGSGADSAASATGAGEAESKPAPTDLPPAMQAGLADIGRQNSSPAPATGILTVAEQKAGAAPGQSDDLLFPTEEELREIKARNKDAGKADRPVDPPAGAAAGRGAEPVTPQTAAEPAAGITSDVDAESWAEYGGWYQQDYTIYYRPAGHKDKFVYSWLTLTGPRALKGGNNPPAAVFDALTGKDAQGSCTKCHSVDDLPGKGRIVNFAPLSLEHKRGRFTRFIHEPHFGVTGDRGCLTCHELKNDPIKAKAAALDAGPRISATADAATRASAAQLAGSAATPGASAAPATADVSPYLKSYEQSDPHKFATEFSAVREERCQSCHNRSMARQDCLLCHTYHLDGVITPITGTKLPTD